jgi:LmbE family N-acetylglucosaminyl deacetylase/SAM-dependent methyltransferase
MSATFTSRDAGADEQTWADAWPSRLPSVTAPGPGQHLLVAVAHPDDETLGAGGLIAAAAAAGASVSVVIATDGEASHPDSPTHSPVQLAQLRRSEVITAVAQLAPSARIEFLGLPDSALTAHEDKLTDELTSRAGFADLLVTPWAGDRHPDHSACALAAGRAASAAGIEHWQFPIWAWHWGTPESPELPQARMRRLSLDSGAVLAKRKAIAAHRSQHTALSSRAGDEAILTASMLAHFARSYEVFILADDAPAANARYFDELYAQDRDPWKLTDRFYERRKRDLLLASLPRERFRRAFEPGCAIGALTSELAQRCDQLVAWDGAALAVEQTSARMRQESGAAHVTVECARIPANWPAGQFDLIVLSEVGYYCPDLRQLKAQVERSLSDDGVLIACHWRHPAPDHPCTAEAVHMALEAGLSNIVTHHEADFLLDVWTRDGISVAVAEGIV